MNLSRPLISLMLAYLMLISSNSYANSDKFGENFNLRVSNNILYFDIIIEEGYRLYGQNTDSKCFPSSIDLDLSHNIAKYIIDWPKARLDKGCNVYTGKLSIPVTLIPLEPNQASSIKGQISYAICKDQCVPMVQEILIPNILLEREGFGTISSINISLLLAAIIGGFILNFMPCVLPVLMLKIFSVINNKGTDHRTHLLCTISGIFVSFWILAFLAFGLRSLGLEFGMGANFQQPEFIIILCILMTIFLSSMLGRFNIDFSNLLPIANREFNSAYINSFFTGVTATIFSTSCTAPFLGSAIAFAMAADLPVILITFSYIGFGFSIPYLLLIFYPRILSSLPKPGPWMQYFKNFLAVAMIAAILWLLSILQSQLGFRAAFGVVLLLLLIKFAAEINMPKIVKIFAILVLFSALMYLPKMAAKEDIAKEVIIEELWQKFPSNANAYKGMIESYIAEGKIVVVDITADWCMTCKLNKLLLWNRDSTIKLLQSPKIVTIRADITNYTREVQEYMLSLGVYGIPFDIVYGPKAKRGIHMPAMPRYGQLKDALEQAGL